MKPSLKLTLGAVLWTAMFLQPSTLLAQGTAFTYQGRLDAGGAPANGLYDLRFTVHDAASGGNQWGPVLTAGPVAVSNGLFTVTLNFGAGIFTGGARWLEIGVRSNGTASAFTTLAPRQAVLPSPYAFWAANASQAVTLSGTVPASGLNGLYSNPVNFNNPANSFTGNGAGLSNVNAAALGGRNAAQFWQTGGNAGTTPGTDFLGTTDNQPVELKVNGQRALRLEPNPNSPNVLGGSPANIITNGNYGAVIAGGGSSAYPNRAGAPFATVGGGSGNIASGISSTIGGGAENRASNNDTTVAGGYQNTAAGLRATVGGGWLNRALTDYTTVGGGQNNEASGDYATVGGGLHNTAIGPEAAVGGGFGNTAGGWNATVPGGIDNVAGGDGSFAAGSNARAWHQGSFVWADSQSTPPPVPQGIPFDSIANDEFAIRARGGVRLNTDTSLFFGNRTRQMINLWGTVYGIGVQNNVHYARSDGDFFWYRKGAHSDSYGDPGPGGTMLMKLTSQGLSVCALEVRGGCDLAEPFAMSEPNIPKGAVVVIDEDHPGQLKLSTRAYDTHVAGVVSGANGVQPGIALKQEGTLDQGENVALSGRVYVQADAAYGPIQPGDLLTTSDTPGCAMKASDPARAQGAILGKAMTGLKEGRGTVLVLVTLQ
jgi:hypothetical protein